MQGKPFTHSHASKKNESVWFKTKLISQFVSISLLLSQPFNSPYLYASPLNGNIVGGAGHISSNNLNIHQHSQNFAIDWDSFNISKGEAFNVNQLNSSSVLLNRVRFNGVNKAKSIIDGQINAKGSVLVVNPNGVFFSSTAQVNVGGIIASSLDIAPSDFMNGNYIFNEVIGIDGADINSGTINASLGGECCTHR